MNKEDKNFGFVVVIIYSVQMCLTVAVVML